MKLKPRREREKETRLNEILAASETIFSTRGYDLATMDDIAREADFTKKTVYSYFASKQELLSAVMARAMTVLNGLFREAAAGEKSGFDKVRGIGLAYVEFADRYPALFKVLSIKAHGDDKLPDAYRDELIRLDREMVELIAGCFRIGQQDGSIRPDLDVRMATLHVVSVSNGILDMVANRCEHFVSVFGVSIPEFIHYSMDLIGDSIRSVKGKKK
ncbi:MAG: TetR/AcrR family transcriptional regulator [Candidatus Delongbacteria bacterium]|nr:TetR/AcrR family transcriptional regulator [Candidatus Delongbacteria bacterium]